MSVLEIVVAVNTTLGKRSTSTTYLLTDDPNGLRVNVFRMESVSPVVISLVSGGDDVPVTFYARYTRFNPTDTVLQTVIDSLTEYAKTLK